MNLAISPSEVWKGRYTNTYITTTFTNVKNHTVVGLPSIPVNKRDMGMLKYLNSSSGVGTTQVEAHIQNIHLGSPMFDFVKIGEWQTQSATIAGINSDRIQRRETKYLKK